MCFKGLIAEKKFIAVAFSVRRVKKMLGSVLAEAYPSQWHHRNILTRICREDQSPKRSAQRLNCPHLRIPDSGKVGAKGAQVIRAHAMHALAAAPLPHIPATRLAPPFRPGRDQRGRFASLQQPLSPFLGPSGMVRSLTFAITRKGGEDWDEKIRFAEEQPSLALRPVPKGSFISR